MRCALCLHFPASLAQALQAPPQPSSRGLFTPATCPFGPEVSPWYIGWSWLSEPSPNCISLWDSSPFSTPLCRTPLLCHHHLSLSSSSLLSSSPLSKTRRRSSLSCLLGRTVSVSKYACCPNLKTSLHSCIIHNLCRLQGYWQRHQPLVTTFGWYITSKTKTCPHVTRCENQQKMQIGCYCIEPVNPLTNLCSSGPESESESSKS